RRMNARLNKNVPGPFYTTGECMACTLPEGEAPDLLAPLEGEDMDTYFLRQPQTAEEIDRACSAALVCCVNAIRYGGHDPAIIRQLGNRSAYCDHILPGGPISFPWESEKISAQESDEYRPWWKFWSK